MEGIIIYQWHPPLPTSSPIHRDKCLDNAWNRSRWVTIAHGNLQISGALRYSPSDPNGHQWQFCQAVFCVPSESPRPSRSWRKEWSQEPPPQGHQWRPNSSMSPDPSLRCCPEGCWQAVSAPAGNRRDVIVVNAKASRKSLSRKKRVNPNRFGWGEREDWMR